LRVPIMYGRVEYLAEGAVDEILKGLLSADTNVGLKLDHYHHRYPLHVADASRAILLLIRKRLTVYYLYHIEMFLF
jgi:hypothetical protein